MKFANRLLKKFTCVAQANGYDNNQDFLLSNLFYLHLEIEGVLVLSEASITIYSPIRERN